MITPSVKELSRVSPHRRDPLVVAALVPEPPAPDRSVAPGGHAAPR
jgi:hypothetical protein